MYCVIFCRNSQLDTIIPVSYTHLDVYKRQGLSSEEAQRRLERYGPNKLREKPKKSVFALFLAQLKDMLIYVLLGATVITLSLIHI